MHKTYSITKYLRNLKQEKDVCNVGRLTSVAEPAALTDVTAVMGAVKGA